MAALVALQFVRAARDKERAAGFAFLAPQLAPHSVDLLEQEAWCLWFLEGRYQSVQATTNMAKIDAKLADTAMQARARVMRLLDYHFQDNALMQAELQDIHQGNGYMDLATDLSRLAGHLTVHHQRVSADPVNYRPGDAELLRGLANEILSSLHADRTNETFDLRNRAWTEFSITYSNMKAAADFLFRNRPADAALFPSLRTAVLALTSRRSSNKTESAAPSPVAPSPVAPAAPTDTPLPGQPSGNPIVG